jgi:hypothetical protein
MVIWVLRRRAGLSLALAVHRVLSIVTKGLIDVPPEQTKRLLSIGVVLMAIRNGLFARAITAWLNVTDCKS